MSCQLRQEGRVIGHWPDAASWTHCLPVISVRKVLYSWVLTTPATVSRSAFELLLIQFKRGVVYQFKTTILAGFLDLPGQTNKQVVSLQHILG